MFQAGSKGDLKFKVTFIISATESITQYMPIAFQARIGVKLRKFVHKKRQP